MFRRLLVSLLVLFSAAGCASQEPPTSTPGPAVVPVATPDDAQTPGPAIAALEEFATFDNPMSVRPVDEGWVIVERFGKLWYFDGSDREEILDISAEIQKEAEQGLYDFVVGEDGEYAYIHFTGNEKPYGDHHIREYAWTGTDIEGEGREVLVIEDPYPHHNAGQMQIGPDGYLYIAIGDGGTKTLTQEADNGDPHGYGQGTDELLGNILRIDPRPSGVEAYGIPDDNPFVDTPERDEIWAYGLRNPWRFSFDKETGDLWVPDVGHRFWEEVNMLPAGEGGQNLGWSALEGPAEYKGEAPDDVTAPVYAYPHRGGPCAVIGGYVYRGTAIKDLVGTYIFGDFCTGELQALDLEGRKVTGRRFLGVKVEQLVALSEDSDGELFVLSYSKGISRLVAKGG